MNAPVQLSEHRSRRVRAGQPVPDQPPLPIVGGREPVDPDATPREQREDPPRDLRWMRWYCAVFFFVVVALAASCSFSINL